MSGALMPETEVVEGRVKWCFDPGWTVTKYDDWIFYRRQFGEATLGNKGMDILALSLASGVLWLIEAKDYTTEDRSPDKDVPWNEVALKVRDTLAGLVAAAVNANDAAEKALARTFLDATRLRVVFHLEQPSRPNSARQIYDPADIQQKLKKLLKPIDAHPKVVDHTTAGLPWRMTWTGTRP